MMLTIKSLTKNKFYKGDKMKKLIVVFMLFFSMNSFANDGKSLAKELSLSASSKASIQWKRIFKKARKMKRYGINKLSDSDKATLQTYLINHAADSDTPEAAGI